MKLGTENKKKVAFLAVLGCFVLAGGGRGKGNEGNEEQGTKGRFFNEFSR